MEQVQKTKDIFFSAQSTEFKASNIRKTQNEGSIY